MLEPENGRIIVIGNATDSEPWDMLAYLRHDAAAGDDGFVERRWFRMCTQNRSNPPATFAGLLTFAQSHRTQITLLAVEDVEAP